MRVHKLVLVIAFALAPTACMTEADKLIFQEVFHGSSDVENTAEIEKADGAEQISKNTDVPADEKEENKAADAKEVEVTKPSQEAS
ncbi:MAG: hypothetical protein ACOH5I_17915 [Oligoflexus sp.]